MWIQLAFDLDALPKIQTGWTIIEVMKKRGRGRPPHPNRRDFAKKCRKPGCTRKPASNQVFCSRECSPLGGYGYDAGWGYGQAYYELEEENGPEAA